MISELLTKNYLKNEKWHKNYLPEQEANKYHERLIMQGNILTVVDNDELKAYMEVWKVDYELLGRLMCGVDVYAFDEDIVNGNIAYINNAWVTDVESKKILEQEFKDKFGQCEFIARKRFKYSDTFKVYPMRSLI